MSRVDVLAVMETAMGQLDKNWNGENIDPASDLREARAAVAELIAALTEEHDIKSWRSDEIGARIIRTDAALARCKGEKA